MSDNLSIDEIIKLTEKIKEDKKNQPEEDDDVKQYVPVKRNKQEQAFKTRQFGAVSDDEEDVKVVESFSSVKVKPFGGAKKDNTNVVFDLKGTKRVNTSNNNGHTKPITIMSKPKKDENSDLDGVPTIVAKEQIFEDSKFREDVGVQITFEGFDDAIESVPTIDEDVAEQILEQRRQEKVGKFRLFGPDKTDTELGSKRQVEDEFDGTDDEANFTNSVVSKKYSIKLRAVIAGVLGVALLMLSVFKDSAYFPPSLLNHTPYFITAIVLYAVSLISSFNVFVHGFNFKRGINFDLPISIVSLLIMAHTIALLVNESLWIDNGVLLAPFGCFSLLLSQLGKYNMMSRIENNYSFINNGRDNYTVENIVNNVDAQIITRGIIDDEPLVKTSVKTDVPTNFLEISCKNEPADKLSNILFLTMLALSLVLFAVIGIKDNFGSALNIAMCSLCISLPGSALLLTNSVLKNVSGSLRKYGSRVCGFEGALMADDVNAMVMEAADLFSKDSCELHGIKTFHGAKVDDAIIQAAAVIIQTKSPLAHVFDDVIIGKQSILPKVDNIVYEDSLGTSAWIYNQKVLVGNRDLLLLHGVDVPMAEFEEKYTVRNRKAVYLAVGGKITAMFVVSYNASPDLKHELKKLEKSGITIILRSCDPYINEDSINKMFSLPPGFIHVMNYSATRVYEKYSNMSVEKSPAYVVHNGSALGFVSAMRGAEIIVGLKYALSFLISFGSVIGFGAVALLSVLGSYAELTALNFIAFQIIWTAFISLISKIRISVL